MPLTIIITQLTRIPLYIPILIIVFRCKRDIIRSCYSILIQHADYVSRCWLLQQVLLNFGGVVDNVDLLLQCAYDIQILMSACSSIGVITRVRVSSRLQRNCPITPNEERSIYLALIYAGIHPNCIKGCISINGCLIKRPFDIDTNFTCIDIYTTTFSVLLC